MTPTVMSTAVSKATPAFTLRALAQARGIRVGAAVAPQFIRREPLYAETLGREFDLLTAENVQKFGLIHPDRNRYAFDDADFLVDYAKKNSMAVRGHTLVWHNQVPNWLVTGVWSREELTAILREHIMAVAGHYRSQLAAWDVVNEAVADDGSMRQTLWSNGIGPDYLDLAFRWAREADPQAKLFYNDYGGEGLGRKSDAIYALVKGMKQRGVPIDGVGLQMHIQLGQYPSPQDVAANVKRLGELGLEVHITEMDVRIKGTPTPGQLADQARVYRTMLQVCLSASNCKAFVLWGFTDAHSWIPSFNPGWGAALIFDQVYQPKPAYHTMMEVLK